MPAISKRYAIFALPNGSTMVVVVIGALRGGVLYFTAKLSTSSRR